MDDDRIGEDTLETFVRKMAGKDVLRRTIDEVGESVEDPMAYAQALYERKAASKLTVDLAESINLPPESKNTTFLSTMYHSIDLNDKSFFTLLDVLKMWPSSVAVAEKMEREYGMLAPAFSLSVGVRVILLLVPTPLLQRLSW